MKRKHGMLIGTLAIAAAAVVTLPVRATVPGGTHGGPGGTVCTSCGPTTIRISAASSGAEPNDQVTSPRVSRDGRYSTFQALATNLVPGDTNGQSDIFFRDRVNKVTLRASISSSGVEGNGASFTPDISEDGRFLTFVSRSTNLTSEVGGFHTQIFVRDMVNSTTALVSKNLSGGRGDSLSVNPVASADGRYIAFDSNSSDLVNADTNAKSDIFRRDVLTGTTVRVSVTSTGAQAAGQPSFPSISGDGRFVTFETDSALHPADTNGLDDIYVWDANTGKTTPVSLDTAGQFRALGSFEPAISGDGSTIAFSSEAPLIASDTNGVDDVYVRTLASGSVVRASVGANNVQSNGRSSLPSITTTGDAVAFISQASNLVSADTNGTNDTFLRRLSAGTTVRTSVSNSGAQGNGDTQGTDVSANGLVVLFQSAATNVVSPDTVVPAPFNDEIYARAF